MGFARKIDLSLDSEILVQEAGILVIDVRRAELMAEKVLKQHSVRLKVALSEWAVRTAEGLQKGEVRLRDQAQAMLAIKVIGNQLYGWDHEPDLRGLKLAKTSDYSQVKSYYQHWCDGTEPPECSGAVNLALAATTPEQLRAMAQAEENRDGQRDPSAKECGGPPPVAPEQPRAVWDGRPSPEREAPPLPVKQPVQPRRETLPPSLSPQERRKQELEELARRRAEWRRGR